MVILKLSGLHINQHSYHKNYIHRSDNCSCVDNHTSLEVLIREGGVAS